MPIYEYQCDECGLQIEKLWSRASLAVDPLPCPECEADMRKLVSVANHTFKHGEGQTRGGLPPNTGTSDDWNFDKAIGMDAADKWEKIEKRESLKDRRIREEREAGRGVTREHLVPTGEGDYRTITEPERVRANENRETAFKIAQAAKEQSSSSE
jgi:putative FmdB family regulatory protein